MSRPVRCPSAGVLGCPMEGGRAPSLSWYVRTALARHRRTVALWEQVLAAADRGPLARCPTARAPARLIVTPSAWTEYRPVTYRPRRDRGGRPRDRPGVVALGPLGPVSSAAGRPIDYLHVRRSSAAGVGRALLAAAAWFADEVGAEDVSVNVPSGLREANRFYAKIGFTPMVRPPDRDRLDAAPQARRRALRRAAGARPTCPVQRRCAGARCSAAVARPPACPAEGSRRSAGGAGRVAHQAGHARGADPPVRVVADHDSSRRQGAPQRTGVADPGDPSGPAPRGGGWTLISIPTAMRPGPAWSAAATDPSVSARTSDWRRRAAARTAGCCLPRGSSRPPRVGGGTIVMVSSRPAPHPDGLQGLRVIGHPARVGEPAGEPAGQPPGGRRAQPHAGRGAAVRSGVTEAPARLLLLDGHSLAYRAFFALPVENFSTTTGQPTNAVYGFTSMLINTLRDEQPDAPRGGVRRLAQDLPHRGVPGVQGEPLEDPGRVQGPGRADPARCSTRCDVTRVDGRGLRGRRRHRHAHHPGASARASRSLIVTGDRDAFQLVTDARHGALPDARASRELARMTPASVEEKYGLTPAQYPDFAALRGDPQRQPARHPRRGREDRRQVDQRVRLARRARRPGRRGQGQGRRRAARRTSRGHAQPPADRAGPRRRAAAVTPDRLAPCLGPRRGAPGLRHPAVPRRCATGCSPSTPEAAPSAGARLRGGRSSWPAPAPSAPAGSPSTRATARAPGSPWTDLGRGAPATSPRSRSPPPTGPPPGSTRPSSTRRDDGALAAWLADPARPKVLHDAKGPFSRSPSTRLDAGRRHQRHRARRLPGAAGPALLRPGRPVAALTCTASCAAAADGRGQLSLDGGEDDRPRRGAAVQARAVLDLAEALDGELEKGGAAAAAARRRAAAGARARRHGAGRDRRRPRASGAAGAAVRGRGPARPRRRRTPLVGRRVQPRLAQAAAGDPVRRAGPAQDQEDQDRLHHRRRRAAVAVRADRAPAARRTCCATATWPSCASPSRAC